MDEERSDAEPQPAGGARPRRRSRARGAYARKPHELTRRQIEYVKRVVAGVPKREAARQAGFSPEHGWNLDRMPIVQQAIDAARVRANAKVERATVRAAARAAVPNAPADAAYESDPPLHTHTNSGARHPATALLDGLPPDTNALAAAGMGESSITIRLLRDLSTCFPHEIAARWSATDRAAAETAFERPWAALVPPDHNPAYFLAERVWFDNVRGNPEFLYPAYHRDRFLAPMLSYILDPAPAESGFLFHGPRYSYKSTFSHGAVPMWYVLRGVHVDRVHRRVVLRHHKFELASDNLVRLKAKFMSHPWLRAVWGPACPAEEQRDFGTSARFTLPWVPPGQTADPSFRAIGLGASDTGRHQDLDIGDDLETEDHLSKVVRDDAKRRYRAKRDQLDPTAGRECNTGTPYHRMGLWKMMIDSRIDGRPVYRFISIPAHTPPDQVEQFGPLALPGKLDESFLEKRRLEELANAGNDDFYYLQYECSYRLSRLQTTEAWWLRQCRRDDIPEDALLIITLDPAWKGDKNYGEGDYASMQVWALARRGSFVLRYLVDGVHSNELSAHDGQRELFRLMERYGVRVIAPELRTGSTFRADIVQQAGSLGIPLVVVDLVTKQQAKADRIGVWLKECEAGRVFICEGVSDALLEDLRDQFDNWPQVDHDDALDAAAYTCDPAILTAWAPAWASGLRRRPWDRRPTEPEPRTRYTPI